MSDFQPTQFQPPPFQPQTPQPQTPPYLPVQSRQSPISQPIPQQQYDPTRYPQQFPQQPRKKERARIVLLIACVVTFAIAGVFGALYIGADSDHDAAVARLEERKSQLADVRERLTTAEDAQESAETRNDDLEAEKATLTTCVEAVQRYLWDGLEGTARDAALDAMFTSCQ